MRSEARRAVLALLGAGAVLAAAAPAASGLSVTLESPVEGAAPPIVEVADDENEVNDITVTVADDRLVVTDGAARAVRPLFGCEGLLAAKTVTCPVPALVRVNGLGKDDRISVTGIDALIYGGEGNDVLGGGRLIDGQEGDDTITGTDGDDDLIGGPGADTVTGGAGNDRFRAGDELEPDRLDGGPGVDVLDFGGRPTPIAADLGTGAQSAGTTGENDTVAGFERVIGGAADDVIRIGVASTGPGPRTIRVNGATSPATAVDTALAVGNRGDDRLTLSGAAAGTLLGGSGDDVLAGGRGDDRLLGQQGTDVLTGAGGDDDLRGGSSGDRLSGGADDDRIRGESGRDRLDGGSGNDRLAPGAGNDRASGGAGRDRIDARDRRRDRVDGGAGRDRATADRVDRVRAVERVTRRG